MEQNTIYRYGPPSKYDHAPYGSLCISSVFTPDGHVVTRYYQTNKDEDNPVWEKID